MAKHTHGDPSKLSEKNCRVEPSRTSVCCYRPRSTRYASAANGLSRKVPKRSPKSPMADNPNNHYNEPLRSFFFLIWQVASGIRSPSHKPGSLMPCNPLFKVADCNIMSYPRTCGQDPDNLPRVGLCRSHQGRANAWPEGCLIFELIHSAGSLIKLGR